MEDSAAARAAEEGAAVGGGGAESKTKARLALYGVAALRRFMDAFLR